MAWNVTSPADTDAIRNGASSIRTLKTDLATALGTEGIFPGPDANNPIFRYAPPRGTTSARPNSSSSLVGRLYLNTTTGTLQRDNGSSWDDITPPTTLLPAGCIIPYAANVSTPPTGFLYCNGQAVSRTTYATLFAIIGTTWGQGDASTTFNVPDLRGVVLRGRNDGATDSYKDPDSATRTNRLTGGATADNVGSVQADGLAAHTHTAQAQTGTGAALSGGGAPQSSGSTGSTGGNETRMRNASVSYIIKT